MSFDDTFNDAYYDEVYGRNKHYKTHYSKIPFRIVMKDLLMWMNKSLSKKDKVLEVGCGTGQFGHFLYDNGYKNYVGFDFSSVAIKQAKKFSKQKFLVANAYDTNLFSTDYQAICSFEFLEHVEKDLEVMKKFKKGTMVFLSVPGFGGRGHVRHFKTVKSVHDRYDEFIDIYELKTILKKGGTPKWHYFYGKVK